MFGRLSLFFFGALCFILVGCASSSRDLQLVAPMFDSDLLQSNDLEYPTAQNCHDNSAFTVRPRTTAEGLPENFRDVSLDEVVTIALQNPKVLRSLGAQVLTNPLAVTTRFDPAIQKTNPIFGEEAALSQFDAQLRSGLNFQNNDDVFNNPLNGGGAREVQQHLVTGNMELNKISAGGTRMALRSTTFHDYNNSPQNLFDHSWTSNWEAEVRQPLLQGRGVTFNRIAGPNAQPGFRFSNGVLISRINHDITIADFESGVIDFVSEVTDRYWQLYFAYRNYEAIRKTRDAAKETWQIVDARYQKGIRGGEKDKESEAREQYYQWEQALIAALNGSSSTAQPGILQTEAELRRLLAMPTNGFEFLRPSEAPSHTMVMFDWDQLVMQAMGRRVELRQQKWRIKQRELELLASRNFTKPRLDLVGTYRNNGFGDDLVGGGSGRFSSALKDMASGDHDEWAFGVEYNLPVGFRQAHAGVRNSELNLQRERAILEEQEQQILHDLAAAYRQIESKFTESEFARKRFKAAEDTVEARNATFDRDLVSLDLLLDAQRRLSDAEVAYHRAAVDYLQAIVDVQRQAGILLVNFGVQLNEGQQVVPASDDQSRWMAQELNRKIDYRIPNSLTVGAVNQNPVMSVGTPVVMDDTDYHNSSGSENLSGSVIEEKLPTNDDPTAKLNFTDQQTESVVDEEPIAQPSQKITGSTGQTPASSRSNYDSSRPNLKPIAGTNLKPKLKRKLIPKGNRLTPILMPATNTKIELQEVSVEEAISKDEPSQIQQASFEIITDQPVTLGGGE